MTLAGRVTVAIGADDGEWRVKSGAGDSRPSGERRDCMASRLGSECPRGVERAEPEWRVANAYSVLPTGLGRKA
jgi:hypothetical protein